MNKIQSTVCLLSLIVLTGCLDEPSEENDNTAVLPLLTNPNQTQQTSQTANPPVNLPANQPANPPVNVPVNQPANPPVDVPVNTPVNTPVDPPTVTPASPPETTTTNTTSEDLTGLWVSECEPDPTDNTSLQVQYLISDATITQSTRIYLEDTRCASSLSLSFSEFSTYTESGNQTNIADGNAQHIDITYTGGSMTASEGFNQLLVAQGTTLQDLATAEGIAVDINNITLAELGRNQAELYSIYRIDARFDGGTDLRIGAIDASYTGNIPELRPIDLDQNIRLAKQVR